MKFVLVINAIVFIVGVLFFGGGIVLIGVSTQLPSGDYFLIGPFSVAAGTILFIRGCINKLAKRQHRREQVSTCNSGRCNPIYLVISLITCESVSGRGNL